jgi:single-stranded DNA-binding protein
MFHRITIIGFVGQDPQMRYTEDGTPVTNFSVATRQASP